MLPLPTALVPFVPSGPDFDAALDFFAELGFEAEWRDGDYASLRAGAAAFILQRVDAPDWAQNQMLVIEVDDLDEWWRAIDEKDLPARFAGANTKAPTDYPWGREAGIIDPAGVCWHVRQGAAKS